MAQKKSPDSPENIISCMHNTHFIVSLNVVANPSHWPRAAAQGTVVPHTEGSSTSPLRAPAAVLAAALPQAAPLSSTKTAWCLLQARVLVSPLVLDKIHVSVQDWCGGSAQERHQIPMVLGALRTQRDECFHLFCLQGLQQRLSLTFRARDSQPLLYLCFSVLVCHQSFVTEPPRWLGLNP